MSESVKLYKVHDYLVGDVIDSGAFASIRVGYSSKTFNPYAVKMISRRKIASCPCAKEIEFAESVITPLVFHPSIITIHDSIQSQGQIFQVMDLMQSGDLLEYLKENNISFNNILTIADKILSAVEYLHLHKICHRDIKPENVLMDSSGNPKLTDFGFATFAHQNVSGRFGSVGYAAPEIFLSTTYDGIKADIWSVGVLLYVLFTKTIPFPEGNEITFEKAASLDYSFIPQGLVHILKKIFVPPNDRPSIRWIRSQPFFHNISSKIENNDPELQLPVERPLFKFTQRISELLNIPFDSVILELHTDTINPSKILFSLLSERSPRMVSHALSFHSCPNRTIVEIPNTHKIISNTDTLTTSKTIQQILMKRRFCITSNSTGFKTAILNTPGSDIKINYECASLEDNQTDVVFTGDLKVPEVSEIFRLLKNELASIDTPNSD